MLFKKGKKKSFFTGPLLDAVKIKSFESVGLTQYAFSKVNFLSGMFNYQNKVYNKCDE
jgi:hypothetical protein